MIIPAYFHDAGVPKTGLSPIIDIYRVSDNSQVVNDGAMTEVGGGFYKYDFAGYDSAQDYLYVCDGTATLSNAYRYVPGSTTVDGAVVDILVDTGTTLPTAIADVPTVAEFEARTIPSANYLVEGDTLARVTLVDTCTTNTDMRGTNSAALASVCTEARLAELDAANLPTDISALQATVDSIGSGTGAALNFAATDDNVDGDIVGAPVFDPAVPFVGVQTSGTYASTAGEDGTKHQIDDTANEIDIVYQFNIGSGRNAAKVIFKGYLSGVGDTCQVKAYNFVTATWDTRATITGQTGTANITKDIALLANHTGTGAYAGLIYVRFDSTASNQTLYVDELLVAGVAIGLTVGYIDGLVWVDANSGTAGTTPFIHGTADNPCTTLADALTIAAAVGITGLNVAPGTTLTLTANSNKYRFVGGGRLALGGQSIEEATFFGLYTVSGTSSGDDCFFEDCGIGDATIYHAYFLRCRMKGTLTLVAGQEYFLHQCFDANESADVQTFVFAAGAKIMMRDWSGGMQINGMVAGDEAIIDGTGRVVIDASCTGGSITLRGHFPVPTGAAAFIAAGGTITQTQRFGTDQIMADTAGTTAINARLPSDPADQSAIEAAITAATSPLATAVAVADLPTNAELTAALAAADDAVLAAIAALNNLSSAGAQAAAAAALTAYGAALQTSVDDLESRLTVARAGYLDNLSGGAVATAAAVAALPTTAQINAEVVDALNVDTYAEPGQGDPPATASLAAKIGYLFKSWRNKKDQDASTWKLYNDAGAVTDQKATISEAGGIVTKGKIGTGA